MLAGLGLRVMDRVMRARCRETRIICDGNKWFYRMCDTIFELCFRLFDLCIGVIYIPCLYAFVKGF